MDNVRVAVNARSYWHPFKSWEKTPRWAQDRALLLVAAVDGRYGMIPSFGRAIVLKDGAISVTLYTKEFGRVVDG